MSTRLRRRQSRATNEDEKQRQDVQATQQVLSLFTEQQEGNGRWGRLRAVWRLAMHAKTSA